MHTWFLAFWLSQAAALSEVPGAGVTASENAMQLAATQRFREAELIVRQQLRDLRNTAPDDRVGLIAAHINLALMLVFQEKLTAAESEAKRALVILEGGTFEQENALRSRIEAVLGKIDFHSGRYRAAEEHLQQVLRLSPSAGGGSSQDLAVVLNDLALNVAAQGDYHRALSYAEEAVQRFRMSEGADDAEFGRVLANFALVLLRSQLWTKADAAYREAIVLLRSHLAPDHPHLGVTMAEHALVLKKLGRKAEAKAVHQRATSILGGSIIGAGSHTVDVRALRQ